MEALNNSGYHNFITASHQELDLSDQHAVAKFFNQNRPEYVFLAAAKVGGIVANNTYRAEFIYENLMIQSNVIHQSYVFGVKKLLFLGSTCIYPKNCPQPMKEEYLLTDVLEYTNEPYAIAKIAGIKMCESYNLQYGTNFISVMPTNLYGPNDNFDLERSHVLPALIRKMHLGKLLENDDWDSIRADMDKRPIEGIHGSFGQDDIVKILAKYGIQKNTDSVRVKVWGTGRPKREFLWSQDMASACLFLMENVDFSHCVADPEEVRNTHINIGTGKDLSIRELTALIKAEVGFRGQIDFDTQKPDGTLVKLTDTSKLNALGWKYTIDIEKGIGKMYDWYTK